MKNRRYEPGGASSGTSHSPSYSSYIAVWGWLIALLMGGTFLSFLPFSKTNIILAILLIALVKAILVTLFFMHMKQERLFPLWVILLSPFLLIGLAVSLIFVGNLFWNS